MICRLVLLALSLLNICSGLNAQSKLKGRTYSATDSVITGVNVFNVNQKLSARSGSNGSYSIIASEGDKIIFSMAGFMRDTITVTYQMLLTQYDITLHVQI